jgi:hypothetical protein
LAVQRRIPTGPLGAVCTSATNRQYSGILGGFTNRCTAAQNLTDNYAITGHYVGDRSSSLYTDAFTL